MVKNSKRKTETDKGDASLIKFKVSLKWLYNSKNQLAKDFRNAVNEQLYNLAQEKLGCYKCSCFVNGELHKLGIEWLHHFQQLANAYGVPIKIISIERSKQEILPQEPKVKVILI